MSGRLLFGTALVVFAAAAGHVLTADVDRLLQVVPDDTFYYLEIARHLARTGRSTFDGLSTTNGYHPLWMAVLWGLATLIEDRMALLRAALGLSFVLHAGVALGVFYAVRRLADTGWGWTAAACWLINPLAFSIAITATEAELSALTVLGVLLAHLRLSAEYAKRRQPSTRQVLEYSAALGLLCLARTDGMVIAALGLSWLAAQSWRTGQALRWVVLRVLVAAAAAAAIMAPWWLFSLSQVGTVVQDSGAMKMLWASERYPTALARLDNVAATFAFFGRRCLTLMTVWNFSWASFTAFVMLLGAAPMVVLTRHARSPQACALRAVLTAMLALTLVYGWALVERQIWWLALPCLATMLVVFTSLPLALRAVPLSRAARWGAQTAMVVLAVTLLARWHVKGYRPYPWQPDVRHSQLAIERIVPASERVGVFNAGIPAFFGSRPVIALDGLVSHQARRHWQARRFDDYLARHRVGYIADEQGVMDKALRFSSGSLHLEELASFPLEGWPTGKRLLWRVTIPTQPAR